MGSRNINKAIASDLLSVGYGFYTHIGQRPQNQDEVLVSSAHGPSNGCGHLFAVADGMGGHPGGGIASRMACDRLKDDYERKLLGVGEKKLYDISRHLVEAIIRIDRAIRLQGLSDSSLEDMGTTLSCLMLAGAHSVIAHVGDSRIYRLRNGRLSCLTVDHTFAQDMVFEGLVDQERIHLHPLHHMLTSVVGTGEPLEWVDARIDRLKANDRFLLCSDGLYNTLPGNDIIDSLKQQPIATDAATELVTRALQNGARDNITAIVVNVQFPATHFQNTEQ